MRDNPRLHVYITKFALTRGIIEKDVEQCVNTNVEMVSGIDSFGECYHKGEWFLTRKEAEVKAESMRKSKIESLKKSIVKLETLKF